MLAHEDAEQLLGALALDAVDADEAAALEAHVETCPRCRAELDAHREVAGLLAYGGSAAPEGLWDRIVAGTQQSPPPLRLDQVRSATPSPLRAPPPTGAAPVRALRRQSSAPLPAWAKIAMPVLAAAVVALVALVGVQLASPPREGPAPAVTASVVRRALTAPGHRSVVLRAPSGPSGASVSVVLLPNGTGYLYDTHLTPLPADRTYQLWGVVGGQRISLGLLGDTPATVQFRAGSGVQALAITDEVASGVVSTSQPFVVVGAVNPPL